MRTVTLNILYRKREKGGRKRGRRKREEGVAEERGRGGRERERESPSKREWIKMN